MIGLLVTHAGLLAWGGYWHSPTLNEPGHLVAGISHWQFGRFELFRVNPPLVRMVAALPVLAVGCETDWKSFYESPGARPEGAIGSDFVAANGERSLRLFTLARWACLPFSLLGGYVCYRWARNLFGASAGILALTLWTFSPNIIAHGQLITSDTAATALGVTAAYCFWKWLQSPNWSRATIAGLSLGLAELTKTSWIIMFGLWPLIWIAWNVRNSGRETGECSRRRQAARLLLILMLAIYVLNLGYGFEGTFTRLRDFQFVSNTLTGIESENAFTRSDRSGNRFADTWFGAIPVPVPMNYLLGLDTQKRDFENFDRPSYLRGKFREKGWWYYYLYALGVKVPLGTWLLIFLAILSRFFASGRICSFRDELFLVAPAICVLILVSSQNGFSHHMRYVLPIFPFVFIWISQLANSVALKTWRIVLPSVVALVWSLGSSLWIYPHSLSYFNELAGGPTGGHSHLINSNIDWGQDLLYLKNWLEEHPEAHPLRLAYYGYFDPKDIGIKYALPETGSSHENDDTEHAAFQPGWYAISVNFLRGYPRRAPDGAGGWELLSKDSLSYFRQFRPVVRMGFSIYVYHITAADIALLHDASQRGSLHKVESN